MEYCRFVGIASILLCLFTFGICSTLAQSNEVAIYQLFKSIEVLDVNGVREAITRGADPNARDPQHEGRFKALKFLMGSLLIQNRELLRLG